MPTIRRVGLRRKRMADLALGSERLGTQHEPVVTIGDGRGGIAPGFGAGRLLIEVIDDHSLTGHGFALHGPMNRQGRRSPVVMDSPLVMTIKLRVRQGSSSG